MASFVKNSSNSSGLSLAVRLQQDHTEAWRDFVELYGPVVDSWVRAAGLSQASRDDVVQEVFCSVVRAISQFDPEAPGATFRGWLWRITRNAVLQHLRSSEPPGRGGSTAQMQLAEAPDPWPDASEFQPPSSPSETVSLLRRAMQQIEQRVEPTTWQAFYRTAVLGHATADVARELQLTPAAVRKAKSRTLQRLRKQLGDQK